MIKKVVKYLLLIICCFNIFAAKSLATANTLGDLKRELSNLRAEKNANESAKNKTKSQISAENTKIKNANDAVEKAENDIEIAKTKIEKSNKEIEKVKTQSEKLLVFYEIMQSDSGFLEYVSGASSMTDLVVRVEAVNQIVDYNQNKLKELETLIVDNENLQVELTKKQEELNENIKKYEASIDSLNNDLSSLVEITLDIDSQIRAQQQLINYYEQIGCEDNELLTACVDVANNSAWLKPLNSGYISSGFGYRSFYLNGKPYSDFHPAVDIAGNAGGTPVYAAAAGTVAAVIYKASCGGNQVYIHVRVLGVDYTLTYAHLMNVYVKVGDSVSQQSVIGTVGGGGSTLKSNGGWDTCSTGYHLHFGVAKGFYLGSGYSSYSKYISNSIMPPMMPGYGKRFYSRY